MTPSGMMSAPSARVTPRIITVVCSLAVLAAACSDSTGSTSPSESSPPTTEDATLPATAPVTLPPVTLPPVTSPPLVTAAATSEPGSAEPVATDPVARPRIEFPSLGDPAAVDRTPVVELLSRLPGSLLDELPAGEQFLAISAGDYRAMSQLLGLEWPDSSDIVASQEWLVDVSRSGLASGYPGFALINVNDVEEFEAELGFSRVDVQDFANVSGSVQFTVLGGDLTLSSDLNQLDNGVLSAGTGDDFFNDREQVTAARPNGVPLRLAAAGGLVAGARATPLVESWLADDSGSLLDLPSLAAVATTLDSVDAVGAEIFLNDLTFQPRGDADRRPGPVEPSLTVPFGALAVGLTAIEGRRAAAVVYSYADEATAATAFDELSNRWNAELTLRSGLPLSELFDVLSVEQVGTTVLVVGLAGDAAAFRLPIELMSEAEQLFRYQ